MNPLTAWRPWGPITWPVARGLWALAAGLAQAWAIASPLSGQPNAALQILSLMALLLLLTGGTGHPAQPLRGMAQPGLRPSCLWRQGLWHGWLFGLSWMAATFWWLVVSMHRYGGLPLPLALAALLILAAALALFYALACALFLAVFSSFRGVDTVAPAIIFSAFWTLAELARGTLWSGFPWGAGGYAQVDGWLKFLPRLVGVYGTGLVAALLAYLLLHSLRFDWRRWSAWVGLTLLAGLGAWGTLERACSVDFCATPPASHRPLHGQVALLQGNIAQDQKFVPGSGVQQATSWYAQQLQASRAPLLVTPETALPVLPAQLPEGYWAALQQRFASGSQAALIGLPMGNHAAGYANSVVGLKPGQTTPYRYDKHHLVPFGEFIPWGFNWFVQMMHIPLGNFEAGPLQAPPFEWQGQRLAPNICYEDLFGEELARRFADPATAPTALVNISNIAWFGNTTAIDQHRHISRMRALEFERPMLRATNTGSTVIIDHRGQVTHALPRHTRGVLTGSYEGRTNITPYAWWASRWGLAPLWGLCLLVAAGGFFKHRQSA